MKQSIRSELAVLQKRTLQALIAGPVADKAWVRTNLPGAHPAILAQGIQKVHAANVKASLGFYLPTFTEQAGVVDWHQVSLSHPTTGGHARLLEYWLNIAWSLAEAMDTTSAFQDLLRIERAQFLVRSLNPIARPELVAAVRSMAGLKWDERGCMDTSFGSFARLNTTYFDVHWIAGHRVDEAVLFGPPRNVFFYFADGQARKTVFSDLQSLALTLCFG